MKIAFITNNYEPIVSGITTSINNFSECLARRGHEVYIFAPEYPNHLDHYRNVKRVFSLKLYYKEKYPLPTIRPSALAKMLASLSIDVLHAHHAFGLGQTALSVIKKYLRLPLVYTYHTMYEDYCHYVPFIGKGYLRGYVIRQAISYTNNCSAVIAPTRAVRDILIGRGCKRPIEVLPTGISKSLASFEHSPAASLQARRDNGFKDDDVILLCVTRLAEEKNCEFLLRAFSNIRVQHSGAKLLIVGGGPLETKLKKTASSLMLGNSVVFAGCVPHSQIAPFYALSDMLLFVSQTETQGLPLVEALRFGLPIVAIESAPSRELVQDQGAGIVTACNTAGFAEAVVYLLNNRETAEEIANRNRSTARRFCSEDLSIQLENIYQSVGKN